MHRTLRSLCFFGLQIALLTSCIQATAPTKDAQLPNLTGFLPVDDSGFTTVDGSYQLSFPRDFGPHPDYRTEWWYYTGNLQTQQARHFGFELTIFRVGLVAPNVPSATDSKWANREIFFAHFAVSDIDGDQFHAFERFSRPGPGLAGAQASPYRVWLEDWSIAEQSVGGYQLQAAQEGVGIELTLNDEMGVILHGENGYSRKGAGLANASYYYSQPRLRAEGFVHLGGNKYAVSGLAWKDHEFSTSVLDENQIGWDWFSLQFEDGRSLMLFQLREHGGTISNSSSGTFVVDKYESMHLPRSDFNISVTDEWRSPNTGGMYPAAWKIAIQKPKCVLEVQPWMPDQEIHFPAVTYWEGAVQFDGMCDGSPVQGSGYVELTGYVGNLPMP